MIALRGLVSLAITLALAVTAQAQNYSLQEKSQVGGSFRYQIELDLKGQLHIQQQGKLRELPQTATARHNFVERVLQAGEHGMIGKTARHYQNAKIDIVVGKNRIARELRTDRRLIVAQRGKDALLTYCPKGTLTREELDLTHHFDSLAVTGLLPAKEVAVGDRWKINNAVVQALCWFDGLTSHSLTCTLVSVNVNKAVVAVNGHADGIDDGATVHLKIDGSYQFDLESGRLISLHWSQKDEREQGPVSPALKADVTIKLTRALVETAPEVNDAVVASLPTGENAPAELKLLSYEDPDGRYQLAPSRDWIMVARTKQHLIFRALERGEFVAQATVISWPKAAAGKHMTAEEFKAAMNDNAGWEPDGILDAKEVKSNKGFHIYRLAASGKLHGLKTVQYFYLVAGPNGDQVVLAFTMTPAQVSRLGNRDELLVHSLVFPSR